MTQLERYAQMMKVNLGKVKATIALHVGATGSVLAQTVQGRVEGIDIHYEVESNDEPERIAGLLRNARNGCYARQTVARPEIFNDTVNVNGKPFNVDDYPRPSR